MLFIFKGQLSYNDIINLPYGDFIALRDIRIKRLQKEQSAIKEATGGKDGSTKGAAGLDMRQYAKLAESLNNI